MRRSVQVPGLQPGGEYNLQIRGINNEDGYGPWSPLFPFTAGLDIIAPSPVTNLNLNWDGLDLIITWDSPTTNEDGSPLQDLRDFVVTITGPSTRTFYTIDETFDFLYGLNRESFGTASADLSVTVVARDNVGNLSDPTSESVEKDPPDSPVLTATSKVNAIELSWDSVFDDDGKHYEIWKDGSQYTTVGTGTTIWTDTDVGEGDHEYFVRAVDWFGQSADSNTVTESQFDAGTEDDVAPNAPDTLEYKNEEVSGREATATLSWSAPTDNVDATDYEDHEGFQVRWRTDGLQPWNYGIVPDERANGTDAGTADFQVTIDAGATLDWGVRAFDRYGNYSSWAVDQETAGEDNSPPETPSTPDVFGEKQAILVVHDLHDNGGTPAPLTETVDHLDIYVGTTSGFTIDPDPDTGNKASTASVDSRIYMGTDLIHSFTYEGVEDANDLYVRVVAVTVTGAESPPSDSASVTVGLIEGVNILDATIDSAKINDLEAHKLIAGEGILNDLDVRSLLLIGENGAIESGEWTGSELESTFDAGTRTGWKLDGQGLYIYEGTIDASLITLQQEANLIDHGYTMFSYFTDWYDDNLTTHANMTAGTSDTWSRYGNYSLQLQGTDWVAFGQSSTDYNITVEGGMDYIVSAYVDNNTGSTLDMRIRLRRDNDGGYTEASFQLDPNETRRVSDVVTLPAATSSVLFMIWSDTASADFFVDGPQLEYRVGNNEEPSVFKPGGVTTLSANQITTGSIDAEVITVENLDATLITGGTLAVERIDTAAIAADSAFLNNLVVGSAQIADASIGDAQIDELSTSVLTSGTISAGMISTGTLYSTTIRVPSTGKIESLDYDAGNDGWMIGYSGSSGFAEFNNIVIRGSIATRPGTGARAEMGDLGTYRNLQDVIRVFDSSNTMVGAISALNGGLVIAPLNGGDLVISDSTTGSPTGTTLTVGSLITSGSIDVGNIDSSSITASGRIDTSSYIEADEFRADDSGSQSNPKFTFSGDLDTGIYRATNGGVYITVNGDWKFGYDNSSGEFVTSGTITSDFYNVRVNNVLNAQGSMVLGSNFDQQGGTTFYAQAIYDSTTTNTGTEEVVIGNSGRLFRFTSTERYKVDIEPFHGDPYAVLDVEPRTFFDKYEYEDNNNSAEGLNKSFGLIAEEVDEIDELRELFVVRDPDGTVKNVDYRGLSVLLIPVVKDLNERVKQLEAALQT